MSVTINLTEGNKVTIQRQDPISLILEKKSASSVSIIQQANIAISLQNKAPAFISIVKPGFSGSTSIDTRAALFIGDEVSEGISDELKPIRDGLNVFSKLRLSKGKTEAQDSFIVRASNNPTLRLIADDKDNPASAEKMGLIRFTRNFEDPLALDLARAIYADFKERVEADGGTVEGSEECVASELELIVAGEYLINMADIRPEYSGSLGSTKADLVFYVNDGTGSPIERVRITADGELIATEIDGGTF